MTKNLERLQEIENMGEEDGAEEPIEAQPENRSDGFGLLLLVQLGVCAMVLVALVFLKIQDREKYQTAVEWYRTEASREIELPHWE